MLPLIVDVVLECPQGVPCFFLQWLMLIFFEQNRIFTANVLNL